MSYCRCGKDSDVYCYGTGHGWEVIVANSVAIDESKRYTSHDTRTSVAKWLLDLRDMGLKVPQRALDRLLREMKE